METAPFTADDIEGGYTTVTTMLFIGQPPFEAWGISDPVEGAWRVRARNAVVVYSSDEAIAVLRELQVDEDEIARLIHAARYGLLSAWPDE